MSILDVFFAFFVRLKQRVVTTQMLSVDEDVWDTPLARGFDNLEGEELRILHVDDFAFEVIFCEKVSCFYAPVARRH